MSNIKSISSNKAPAAIGPYSQAVKAGDFIFCSGQIAMDPDTGDMIDGSIEKQTHQVLQNLQAVLKAAGCSFDDVVKTTVYLAYMTDFPKFNKVYGKYFQKPYPARATVEVGNLAKNTKLEIDAIAYICKS